MITYKQWENKEKEIPNDLYIPEYMYFKEWNRLCLVHFRGKNTGVVLSKDFADILEPSGE